MTYIPTQAQIIAHCKTEQFIGYGGAMGGGKTRWLCEMAKLLSAKFPGNLGVVARQSGPALKLSTLEVFQSEVLVPGTPEYKELGVKYHKGDGIFYFTALDPPSKIWFTGLDSDNLERIKSLNLGFFCLDEATEIAESIFMMFQTRLRRAGIPKIYRKGLISANPEAGWVKRRFIDCSIKNHAFVQANFKDNPHLPEEYGELFDAMPQHWIDRYLHGSWGAVTGLIWKEFDPERHIIPVNNVPPDWIPIRGFDHGQQNPAACIRSWYGYPDSVFLPELIGKQRVAMMDPRYDNYPVLVCDKLYHSPGLVSEHRKAINEMFGPPSVSGLLHSDPSIWAKDREKLVSDGKAIPYSIAQEYMEEPNGLKGLVRGNNRVNVGLNRISQLLKIGHLYFMDDPTMEPLIGDGGEIRSYAWKKPRTDDDDWPEEPDKKRDHACDALRYMAMSLPPLQAEKNIVVPHNSFAAARARAIAAKRKGKFLTVHKGRLTKY